MRQFIIALLALSTQTAMAFSYTFKDAKEDFVSPVTTEAVAPVIYGSLLTGLTLGFKHEWGDPLQKSTVDRKPLGKSSKFGNLMGLAVPNAVYTLGALATGYWGSSESGTGGSEGAGNILYYRRAQHMAVATIDAGIMTQILKFAAREPRPDDPKDKSSFPSGHSATAFAFASAVQLDHGWAWGAPAYALATFVAYSRINDNRHRLHDVVAGATIGIGYGLGVGYSMKAREQSPTKEVALKTMYIGPNSENGESLYAVFNY
jgi:hypothetical protein